MTNQTKKEYRAINIEHYKKYQKEYRNTNRIILNGKLKIKTNCECGGNYTYANKIAHHKTKKHQKYINKIN